MKCFLISKRVDVESLQKGQENTDQKLEINMSYLSSVWDPTKILSDLKLKTVKWDPKKKSIKNSHSCSNKCQTVSPKQYLKEPQKGKY